MTCRLQQLSEERGDSRRKLLLLTSSRCFPAGVAAERLEGKLERADANSLSSRPTQRVRNKQCAVTSNRDDNGKRKKKKVPFHNVLEMREAAKWAAGTSLNYHLQDFIRFFFFHNYAS